MLLCVGIRYDFGGKAAFTDLTTTTDFIDSATLCVRFR